MGTRWQACAQHWRVALVVLVPLLLLPLVLVVATPESKCGYVMLMMSIFWMTEVTSLSITALLPVVLFPLLGVLSTAETCLVYMNQTNMVFFGGITLALAVEHCRLHERIALFVILHVGQSPRRLLVGFMLTTMLLSMWISNTATTAMMIPIVEAVVDKLAQSSGDRLPNCSDDSPQLPLAKGDFELAPDLRANNLAVDKDKHIGDVVPSCLSNEEKDDNKKTRNTALLATAYASNIGGTGTVTGTNPNLVLLGFLDEEYGEDTGLNYASWMAFAVPNMLLCTLAITGVMLLHTVDTVHWRRALFRFFHRLPVATRSFITSGTCQNGSNNVMGVFAKVSTDPTVPGTISTTGCPTTGTQASDGNDSDNSHTTKSIDFTDFTGPTVPTDSITMSSRSKSRHEGVRKVLQARYKGLGPVCFHEGAVATLFLVLVVLWFTRAPQFMPGWGHLFVVGGKSMVGGATPALLVVFLLAVIPAHPWRVHKGPGPPGTLLTWKVVKQRFPWEVLLIMGGGFALAKGTSRSGLSCWISGRLTVFTGMSSPVVVFLVCLLTATMTEFMSNTAVIAILLPVLKQLAAALGVNPLYLMLPATLSSSFAFMLPVATPPNALVFSAANISLLHMVRVGFFLNVSCLAVLTLTINTIGGLVFDLHNVPPWANTTSAGGALCA